MPGPLEKSYFSPKPSRNYYRESLQPNRRRAVANCPTCKKPGRIAAQLYEVAQRIPRVMAEGVIICQRCSCNAVFASADGTQLRLWYCAGCQVCLCTACAKQLKN